MFWAILAAVLAFALASQGIRISVLLGPIVHFVHLLPSLWGTLLGLGAAQDRWRAWLDPIRKLLWQWASGETRGILCVYYLPQLASVPACLPGASWPPFPGPNGTGSVVSKG
jgi:hypothetical protein